MSNCGCEYCWLACTYVFANFYGFVQWQCLFYLLQPCFGAFVKVWCFSVFKAGSTWDYATVVNFSRNGLAWRSYSSGALCYKFVRHFERPSQSDQSTGISKQTYLLVSNKIFSLTLSHFNAPNLLLILFIS